MTDINKLNLLINAEIIENKSNYALYNDGMKKGSEIAQSIILHQNRWRKVSDELPKENRCSTSLPVLVKTKYRLYHVAYYSYKYNDFIIGNASICSVTEWKPIE